MRCVTHPSTPAGDLNPNAVFITGCQATLTHGYVNLPRQHPAEPADYTRASLTDFTKETPTNPTNPTNPTPTAPGTPRARVKQPHPDDTVQYTSTPPLLPAKANATGAGAAAGKEKALPGSGYTVVEPIHYPWYVACDLRVSGYAVVEPTPSYGAPCLPMRCMG